MPEEDILKLREAKYLAYEVSHRLPAQGQAVPAPEPGEFVVFVSHLRRGLGFPMDPFVRGLMFYYGLEFHDLAPESILHISSFIVICEAFLRTTPHFGLWLKTFNVEPKMIEGRQAECGGGGYKQEGWCSMARGLFSGGVRFVAAGVVLYHRSQGQQAEATARLSLGPSTTADVMGQQRD